RARCRGDAVAGHRRDAARAGARRPARPAVRPAAGGRRMSLLEMLERGGWLRAVDAELARVLQRHAAQPANDAHELVFAAAALASRAIVQGHAALPLAQVPALLREIAPDRPPPALPELDDWLAALQASPWVALERDDNLAEVARQATPLV